MDKSREGPCSIDSGSWRSALCVGCTLWGWRWLDRGVAAGIVLAVILGNSIWAAYFRVFEI
jgi:hypothetical protein